MRLSSRDRGAGLQRNTEFQRYDGWYNNLANADWGSVGSRLYRKAPSNYADGVYMLDDSLPSARVLSELVFAGADGLAHTRNCTTMLAFFSRLRRSHAPHECRPYRSSGRLRNTPGDGNGVSAGDA
jgi:hypothetical protein